MKNFIAFFICCALASFATAAGIDKPTAPFAESGFSITPPKVKVNAGVAVLFNLPEKNGFVANVNVMIFDWDQSLADYAKLAEEQIKGLKGQILAQKKISETEWLFEYEAELPNGKMHCYARAILGDKKVYLSTARDRASEWKNNAAVLMTCVDSFKLTK